MSWCFVALWSLFIFATIPILNTILKFVNVFYWGLESFTYVVIATTVIAVAVAAVYLFHRRLAQVSNYAWLLMVAAVFVGYTIELRKAPQEGLHFVQYGLLGLLIYRALSHRIHDVGIYFTAAMLATSVGIIDEAIQWAQPDRTWGLKDIWLDFFAAALTQVAIAKGLKPSIIDRPLSTYSLQLFCRLSALMLLLLGVCLFNTPKRIAWYTERIRSLEFLKTDESMLEYGYLYTDPEIGRFRSRLSPTTLRKADTERGQEVARILDRFRHHSTYKQFLEKYTPVTDPFVHEARVHLFRRDRFMQNAEEVRHVEKEFRDHITVAFRENQIIRRYFPNTLQHSSYVLLPKEGAILRQNQISDQDYDSPVSNALVTRVSERQIMVPLVLTILGLLIAGRYYGQKGKST